MRRSHQQIIDAAVDGEAGRLVFAFQSADKVDRMAQMNEMLRRITLDGLAVRVLLSPDEAKGQPVPAEVEGRFRTWSADASVPVGEFHLSISKAQ